MFRSSLDTNILERSIFSGFVISILLVFIGFSRDCDNISKSILRLHIIANSNNEEDQNLKLKIRDKILEESSNYFSESVNDLVSAEKAIENNISNLKNSIEIEVLRHGFDQSVKIEIKNMYFNTCKYNDIILPAGFYDAIRITLGKGSGRNWFCVMFPAICISFSSQKSNMESILTFKELNIVKNKGRFKIKFKIIEIFISIKTWIVNVLSSTIYL
ncbi:MAG: stage II sporulation protein R [Candidatus Paraimprobicoccus trichonymphae]|uniref:Stage II sporulation protein R n=1 Tax=Candidatus Paraimprobicoccus trichonymphae TaxID=3033793 RepID=A0AA48IAC9_9FIRM|nr:MAG: stage II sporulation protein R [Candidatus Paraimprobicoccus trichonymphae]